MKANPFVCERCDHVVDAADTAIKLQLMSGATGCVAGRPVIACSYTCAMAMLNDSSEPLPRKRGHRDAPSQARGEAA